MKVITTTNTANSCSSSGSSNNNTLVRKSLEKQEKISVLMDATYKIRHQKAYPCTAIKCTATHAELHV
jgi:hypothetical protein